MQSSQQHGQKGKRTRPADEGDNQEWSKQRKRSKRSRLSKDGKEGFGQLSAGGAPAKEGVVVSAAESKQRIAKRSQETPGWSLSRAGGGRLTNMDPIFTPDGR